MDRDVERLVELPRGSPRRTPGTQQSSVTIETLNSVVFTLGDSGALTSLEATSEELRTVLENQSALIESDHPLAEVATGTVTEGDLDLLSGCWGRGGSTRVVDALFLEDPSQDAEWVDVGVAEVLKIEIPPGAEQDASFVR